MPRDIGERTRCLLEDVMSVLVDALFLCFWVGTQYGVNLFIRAVNLTVLDQWVLRAFQVVFAISTLVPVLIYVVKDIVLMVLIGREEITSALNSGADESDAK